METLPGSKVTVSLMHIIVLLFGIGSWIAINAVWVELPILVQQLPEGWGLPSFLVILTQAANIGPLVVALMQGFLPRYYHQNVLIYTMLIMGTSSCFLLVFLWDVTAYMGGNEHSVGFFSLFLILGFVDCTSSVTFMPFMTRFQSIFLTTYFIGEGLSGFIPSIFALIQGASQSHCKNETFVNATTNSTQYHVVTEYGDPRFSVEVFFGLLCVMMALCFSSFVMLNYSKTAKSFVDCDADQRDDDDSTILTSVELSNKNRTDGTPFYTGGYHATSEDVVPVVKYLSLKQYAYFYGIVFWISAISNGVMPSVISYSSLPYGQLPYHFAAVLGAMSNPLACFLALFLPVKSHSLIGVFAIVTTGFASYLMFLAVESPCPVLVDSAGGAVIMVISQIFFVFTTSYAKVSIGQIMRARGHAKSLMWYGAFTQLGALIGAVIMFPLVNIYYLFESGDQCTTVC